MGRGAGKEERRGMTEKEDCPSVPPVNMAPLAAGPREGEAVVAVLR